MAHTLSAFVDGAPGEISGRYAARLSAGFAGLGANATLRVAQIRIRTGG